MTRGPAAWCRHRAARPVGSGIALERLPAGMPMTVVTEGRDGTEWVAVLGVERVSPAGSCAHPGRGAWILST
jgi:hypothetical protein